MCGQITLCGGGCATHRRMFSSILSSTHQKPYQVVTTKNVSGYWFPGGAEVELHPVETYWLRPSVETGRGETRSDVGAWALELEQKYW